MAVKSPEDALKDITAFHGHGGPWAALGYRAGMLARSSLGPEGIHGMEATVSLRYERPYSCFLDGLQLASGCTVGKKSLSFQDAGGEPVSVFRSGGRTICVSIRPDVLHKITPPDDGKALWVLRQDDDALFAVK